MPVRDLTGGGTGAIVAIVHISAQKPNAYFKLSIVKLNNSDFETFIQNVSDQKKQVFKECYAHSQSMSINMSDPTQIKSEGDPKVIHPFSVLIKENFVSKSRSGT